MKGREGSQSDRMDEGGSKAGEGGALDRDSGPESCPVWYLSLRILQTANTVGRGKGQSQDEQRALLGQAVPAGSEAQGRAEDGGTSNGQTDGGMTRESITQARL